MTFHTACKLEKVKHFYQFTYELPLWTQVRSILYRIPNEQRQYLFIFVYLDIVDSLCQGNQKIKPFKVEDLEYLKEAYNLYDNLLFIKKYCHISLMQEKLDDKVGTLYDVYEKYDIHCWTDAANVLNDMVYMDLLQKYDCLEQLCKNDIYKKLQEYKCNMESS